jgi:ComF family protein
MRALVGRDWPAWPQPLSKGRAQWGQLGNALLDLIFPPRCAGCGQSGSRWCSACQASVHVIRDPICSHCGRPMENQPDTCLCPPCRYSPLDIDGIRSAVMFEGPLREAIHHLKYSGRTSLAATLGAFLSARWQADPPPADTIVPVPLHASRVRERGYNQSALLAEQLSRASGLLLAESMLTRVRATAPQVTLNAAERKLNVRDAFRASGEAARGKRVLLVDDVCTTGATLESCSLALRQVGVASVWAITLARAP